MVMNVLSMKGLEQSWYFAGAELVSVAIIIAILLLLTLLSYLTAISLFY